MNCETVDDLLLDFIEGQLDARQAQALRAHLDTCGDCRAGVEEMRRMLAEMDEMKREQSASLSGGRRGETLAGPPPVTSWRPGHVLGDFEILEEIGRGGMGVVYRARQLSLNRIVALKVLPGTVGLTPKTVARFRNEAQAAAKLHHTNIVPVYAQGEQDGHFYYAMELVDGQSLDRVMLESPSLVMPSSAHRSESASPDAPPCEHAAAGMTLPTGPHPRRADYRSLALLIAGVAEGLEHAHRQGVIHRDIKPQNLILGADGLLHITDFGLARLLHEPSVTVTGEMLGTPAYMSPEQVAADRKKIDHRTDIYSLGVTLYELLSGRRPFEGATREQVIARIRTDEPRPPRKLKQNIPIDLETICLRAMEKESRRRYQSAREMAADLRRYAEDRPIVSRRVGPIEKAVKWVRRHPALTAIVALSAALIVGTSVWAVELIQARRAQADRLVAEAYGMLAFDDYREPEPARAKLDQAERLGAHEADHRVAAALSWLRDDPGRAISELERVLALRPDDSDVMYLLAWAFRANEQNQRSAQWLRKAQEAGGARTAAGHFFHGQAVVRTNPEEAEAAYRAALLKRENYAQAAIHLARSHNHWMYHHRKHERFIEQEQYLKMACVMQEHKAYPRYLLSIAYRLSAEIYEESGNHADAEKHYELALQLAKAAQAAEPESPQGYACEGEYWESRKDYSRAIDARNRGAPRCQRNSDSVELHQYRWRLFYWVGELSRAVEDLAELQRLCQVSDPRKVWYSGLFPALIAADRGDMEKAVRLARSMAESRPGDFRSVTSTAVILRMFGRGEEADALLAEQATRLDVDTAPFASASPRWTELNYAFCRSLASWEDLEAAAGAGAGDKLVWSAASFFEAASRLAAGERDAAMGAFRRCEQTFDYDDYCYLARVFVRKLEGDSSWPKWMRAPASVSE